MRNVLCLFVCCTWLCSCSWFHASDGPPDYHVDVSRIPNAVPRSLPRSRIGNPPSYVVHGKRYYVLPTAKGYRKRGIASWYGTKFHGEKTSSGEPYDMLSMTAASKVLPLPTFVRVTNLDNDRSIIVKVNDRGPFHENRIIDLSYVAAKKLGMLAKGTAFVEVDAITPGEMDDTPVLQRPRVEKQRTYIQLAAFSELDLAKRYAKHVAKESEHNVRIQKHYIERLAKYIYRVQIGPFTDLTQAKLMAKRFAH